ncbi:MAG: tetratricopeptide repeat protein, partial [Cyclobacteriaceae bacterium]|nr:tetratricopeptide repeat protein [Cyclobacteriaceae bacterium]
ENLIYTLDSIDEISPNLELQLIEVYLKQGSHTKSLELISDHLDEFRNRATDGKGGKSERKLSKIEYSMMLNYATENFLLKGELQKADSVLNSYDAWFSKNLSREDKTSVHQELLFAGLYNSRNEKNEAQKIFEKAYQHSKNGRKSYDKFVLEIHEQLILAYIRYNKKSKINSEIEDFKKLIKDNYSKKSYLNQVVTYVEMEKQIGVDSDPETIRKSATTISYDAATLPKFHELKLKALQQLYELAILSDDFNSALVYLESTIETNRNLYGASSPKFHISQLQLANFYLQNTNKIQSADSIYQISWEQVVKDEIAPEHKNYISIKNKQAKYYEAIDQFDLASKALDEATIATIHTYDRDDINFAVQLNKIANLQISLGEYKKAEKYLQMAMEVFDEQKVRGENTFFYSNTLVTEARLFTARGMFDEAEKNLKRA